MSNSFDDLPIPVQKFLNSRGRLDSNGHQYFADDDGSPILDLYSAGVPNADVHATVKWTRTYKPELWHAATPTPAETAQPAAPTTVSQIMTAVRSGKMTIEAAHAAMPGCLSLHAGTAPAAKTKTSTFNWSAEMAAARSGDAAALARLNKSVQN